LAVLLLLASTGEMLKRLGGFDEQFYYYYYEDSRSMVTVRLGCRLPVVSPPCDPITHLGGHRQGRFTIAFAFRQYRNRYPLTSYKFIRKTMRTSMSPVSLPGCYTRGRIYAGQYVRPSDALRDIGIYHRAPLNGTGVFDPVRLFEKKRAITRLKSPSMSRNNLCECQNPRLSENCDRVRKAL